MINANEAINMKKVSIRNENKHTISDDHSYKYLLEFCNFEDEEYLTSQQQEFHVTRVIYTGVKKRRKNRYVGNFCLTERSPDKSTKIYSFSHFNKQTLFSTPLSDKEDLQDSNDISVITWKPRNVVSQLQDLDYPDFVKKLISLVFEDKDFLKGLSKENLDTSIEYIAKNILKIHPDKINFELTTEKSIYYTIIKRDKMILFDHYLKLADAGDELEEDVDITAIFSIYKNKNLIKNFQGGVMEALENLQSFFKA